MRIIYNLFDLKRKKQANLEPLYRVVFRVNGDGKEWYQVQHRTDETFSWHDQLRHCYTTKNLAIIAMRDIIRADIKNAVLHEQPIPDDLT